MDDQPFKRMASSSLLRDVAHHKRVVVKFSDVCAWVPLLPGTSSDSSPAADGTTDDAKGKSSGTKPSEKQVLFSVSGVVQPGSIMAIMGPSGSGKSSLLSILGGRSPARLAGSVLFNGQPLSKLVKRKLGFVTQDDLLYADLTTFETLYFAAMLRLPSTWSRAQKLERIEMVLMGLGLSRCRDTIIGNAMRRGVSGGERKRVSIGHELLINPSVICLDEPTSGLDSTTALHLVHTLRSLASGGRAVLASIHQPSSRLYMQFDQLLLLAQGHPLYYGDALAVTRWLEQCGQAVPFGVSTPDHLLDLASSPSPSQGAGGASDQQLLYRLIDTFRNRTQGRGPLGITAADFSAPSPPSDCSSSSQGSAAAALASPPPHPLGHLPSSLASEGLVVLVNGPELELQGGGAGGWKGGVQHKGSSSGGSGEAAQQEEQEEEEGAKWGTSWTQQVSILTTRCIRTRRFEALSVQRFAEVLITAFLAGLFWFQAGAGSPLDQRQVADTSGLLFFQVLFMAFSCMFSALFTFPSDFAMLRKERQSGMYRLSAYYTARSLSDIPMDLLVPTLFCIIVYWMGGLRIAAGSFFANLFSMLLVVLVAQSIGLLVGATILHPRTAIAFCTVMMLCTMLVAGFYVTNMPVWIAWMKYTSFVWYGYNLLLKIEFSHRGYSCSDLRKAKPEVPQDTPWCSVAQGQLFGVDVDEAVTLEVCVLLAALLVLRWAVYQALKMKTTFRQRG